MGTVAFVYGPDEIVVLLLVRRMKQIVYVSVGVLKAAGR